MSDLSAGRASEDDAGAEDAVERDGARDLGVTHRRAGAISPTSGRARAISEDVLVGGGLALRRARAEGNGGS